jgi:hypothetical protein
LEDGIEETMVRMERDSPAGNQGEGSPVYNVGGGLGSPVDSCRRNGPDASLAFGRRMDHSTCLDRDSHPFLANRGEEKSHGLGETVSTTVVTLD